MLQFQKIQYCKYRIYSRYSTGSIPKYITDSRFITGSIVFVKKNSTGSIELIWILIWIRYSTQVFGVDTLLGEDTLLFGENTVLGV